MDLPIAQSLKRSSMAPASRSRKRKSNQVCVGRMSAWCASLGLAQAAHRCSKGGQLAGQVRRGLPVIRSCMGAGGGLATSPQQDNLNRGHCSSKSLSFASSHPLGLKSVRKLQSKQRNFVTKQLLTMASQGDTQQPKLLVWDFDWSMINNNCDVWVLTHLDALHSQRQASEVTAVQATSTLAAAHDSKGSTAPQVATHKPSISSMNLGDIQRNWTHAARHGGSAVSPRSDAAAPATWTDGMHGLFQEAALRGHTIHEIRAAMAAIPVFDGVVECIRSLHEGGCVRQIILSDANTHLIQVWLQEMGVQQCFSHIISNHGTVLPLDPGQPEQHALHVEPLQPKSAPHGCLNPCPPNLCKGGILLAFLASEFGPDSAQWPQMAYVGDGRGDLCALLQLPAGGTAMVRGGYPLDKHTAKLLPSSEGSAVVEEHTRVRVPGAPWVRAAGGGDAGTGPVLVDVEVRSGALCANRVLWEDGEQLVQHLRLFGEA